MSNLSNRVVFGVAILIGTAAVLALFARCEAGANDGGVLETAIVDTMEVESYVEATGVVALDDGAEVKVGPRISGVLSKLFVRVGDRVERGQEIAALDDEVLAIAVATAEAELRASRIDLAQAERNEERRARLFEEGIISLEQLQEEQSFVESLRAHINVLESRLEAARVQKGFSTVRSPISGTVVSINTQPGEAVASSFAVPTFVSIMDLSRMTVDAFVDEIDIGSVDEEQHVLFTADAFPDETFEGRVTAVIPRSVERNGVVHYIARIGELSPNTTVLRPEMTVTVRFDVGEAVDIIVVPQRFVKRDLDGTTRVNVKTASGFEDRRVSLGSVRAEGIEVVGGLRQGEEIVLLRERDL